MNPPAKRVAIGLRWTCLVVALVFFCFFLYVSLQSMTYPFHLEWMEGQNIDVVARIAKGLPVYTEPTIEYVPFIYTPYFYYVVAFVSLLTGGVDFFPGRLVSTLATLGCAWILFAWIRKEGAGWVAGVIGASLYLATYKLSGRWFDAARVDSLFMFLTISGLFMFYHYRGWMNALGAAALLTMAFFTKQTALMIALPVIAAFILIDHRHALMTGLLMLFMIGIGIVVADQTTDGWFSYYVFEVPSGHHVDKKYIIGYWFGDLLRPLGILLALCLVVIFQWIAQDWRKGLWYGVLFLACIGASYASRLHWGGYYNVLMPAHAGLALIAGLSFLFFERMRNDSIVILGYTLILVQMLNMTYNPLLMVPDKESIEKGNRFLEEIAKIKGDIFMPELQFVQTRIGKKSYSFGMAAYDIFRSDLPDKAHIKEKLQNELEDAIASHQFTAIMPGRLLTLPEKEGSYRYRRHIEYPKEYVTGAINFVKTNIYVPIRPPILPLEDPSIPLEE